MYYHLFNKTKIESIYETVFLACTLYEPVHDIVGASFEIRSLLSGLTYTNHGAISERLLHKFYELPGIKYVWPTLIATMPRY